jgi:ribosome biogenesis GTPase / thiamine phosphate phosphatase
LSKLLLGTVQKSTGSWYQVKLLEENKIVLCRIAGKFRIEGINLTNPIAVGDIVGIELEQEEKGSIKTIQPRKNYIVRQSPKSKFDLHLLASNVDQAILIVTIVQPNLKLGFIDRYCLMTEPFEIPLIIVFNKADLYNEEDQKIYYYLKHIYTKVGYKVLLTSTVTGEGLEELKELIHDKQSLVSGQSGVGKSSLINTIDENYELRVGEISDFSGKGQHTTTFAEMFELKNGGTIIDTPGIKILSFNYLKPIDIAHNFPEFFDLSPECKFRSTCLHRHEPNCAVKDAIEKGTISELRYQNYLQILEDVENQNYWEIQEA